MISQSQRGSEGAGWFRSKTDLLPGDQNRGKKAGKTNWRVLRLAELLIKSLRQALLIWLDRK